MKINMAGWDRIARGVVAVVFLILAIFVIEGPWAWILGIVGVIFLFTTVTGFCPIYAIIGKGTGKS